MERVLLDAVVETDYGQFDLVWGGGFGFDGDVDKFFAGQVNGLVGAASPGGVYVHFGRRSGGSPVRIVLCTADPGPADESWEDVVEVSVEVGGDVGWESWDSWNAGELEGIGPGGYRLRVCARGRDAGEDGEFADGPVDAYLLQLWPGEFRPDAILRVGSRSAEYWHREWGSRRSVGFGDG